MMVVVVDVSSIDEDDNDNDDEDGVRRCKGCRLHKITEEKAELDLWMNAMENSWHRCCATINNNTIKGIFVINVTANIFKNE